MRRLAIFTLTIAATLLGIFMLWLFSSAVVLFATSLAISAMLRPLVQQLEQYRIGRGWAILICYIGMLIIIGLFGYIVFTELSQEIIYATTELPQSYIRLREGLLASEQALARNTAQNLPPDGQQFLQELGFNTAYFSDLAVAFASNVASNLVFILAVLSLAFYWLSEITRFERLWLALLPVAVRIRARDIWRNTESAVGTYIRAIVLSIVLATLLLYVIYWVIGLPMPMTMALLGGFSHLFPRIGPAIGVLPAILMGLMSVSPIAAVLVAIGSAGIQVIIHHIGDRIMRRGSIPVNPLLQVLTILVLAELAGLWAMIFAPPLAALVQVLYSNVLASSNMNARESAIDLLTERLEAIREQIDPENRELQSALQRGDDLLGQARTILNER